MDQKKINFDFRGVKAVLFDMDGTLIDTEKYYSVAWPKAVASCGYHMSIEQFYAIRSLGEPFLTPLTKEWFGEEFDIDEAKKYRNRYFDELSAAGGIQRKPGAREILSFFREKGIMTAIVTATPYERALVRLAETELDGFFDKVISARMVKSGKPAPDVYLHACRELGLSPEDCMAVEDSPNGVTSAYRAGLPVVMVPDLTKPDTETEEKIIFCAEKLTDIKALFE